MNILLLLILDTDIYKLCNIKEPSCRMRSLRSAIMIAKSIFDHVRSKYFSFFLNSFRNFNRQLFEVYESLINFIIN